MSKRSRRRRRKKKIGISAVGNGPHHEVSPMGHGTCTKTKQEIQEQLNQKKKQNQNWEE